MKQQYVEELKSLPMGFKLEHNVMGFPLYTSRRLTDNFSAAIARCRNTRPVLQEIKGLIDNKVIIPVVSYSGFLRYIIQNTLTKSHSLDINGMYDIDSNKLYIVSDLKFRDFFKSDSEDLGVLVLHELMHYCSANKPKVFNAIFKNINAEFFHQLFKQWVQMDIPMTDCSKLNDYIFVNIERGKNTNLFAYTKFLATIIPNSPNHPIDYRESIIETIINLASYLKEGNTSALFMDMKRDPMLNNLIVAIMNVYKKHFKLKDPDTFPMQELYFPSEIAAVLTHKPMAQHYTAIKKIT